MNKKDLSNIKNWYVVYTRSRAEKKVCDDLSKKNIECFVPLQKQLRKWKDRKKWVDVPVISGYCFVCITPEQHNEVIITDNVVCYVMFEGQACKVQEKQIDYLKRMLNQMEFEVTVSAENFKKGKKVEIIAGPLIGLQGELIENRGNHKFILRFEQINSSFTVEVPAEQISMLPEG